MKTWKGELENSKQKNNTWLKELRAKDTTVTSGQDIKENTSCQESPNETHSLESSELSALRLLARYNGLLEKVGKGSVYLSNPDL